MWQALTINTGDPEDDHKHSDTNSYTCKTFQ